MKNFFKYLLVPLIPALLSGCVDSEFVMRLSPDGSGTIEEKLLLDRKAAEGLLVIMQSLGKAETAEGGSSPARPLDIARIFKDYEGKLAERAEDMGGGVSYVTGEPLESESRLGYRAVYAFTDVTGIRVSQAANRGAGLPQSRAAAGGAKEKQDITFRFEKGDPATLVIVQPAPDGDVPAPGGEDLQGGQQPNIRLLGALGGLRILVALEAGHEIVETNAAYREGNRVTLVDIDAGQFADDGEGAAARLQAALQGGFGEVRKAMRDIPGVKIEPAAEVLIRFR
jgi:hypothetical protein